LHRQIAKYLPGLKVGDQVFVLITPQTPNLFLQSYRPKPYFVLETKVEEVRPDTTYRFDTNFLVLPGRVFRTLDYAKQRLVRIFAKETDGILAVEKVRLVTSEEETEGTNLITKEIHDRHSTARPRYASTPID